VSRLSNAIISIFRKGEKRISSEEFESAVNQVLLSDTVADATKKPIITPSVFLPHFTFICIKFDEMMQKNRVMRQIRWVIITSPFPAQRASWHRPWSSLQSRYTLYGRFSQFPYNQPVTEIPCAI